MSDQRGSKVSSRIAKADSRPLAYQQERTNALLELAKAVKTVSFYPEGHPQLQNSLSQALSNIRPILQTMGEMAFEVSPRGFFFQSRPVGESFEVLTELARDMHLRQIKKFALRRSVTSTEFEAFLQLLILDPDKFRSGTLIEEYFRTHQIRGIWVNEIQFGRPFSPGKVAQRDRPEPESRPDETTIRARELLSLLEQERDPDRFLQITREIEVICGQMIHGKKMKQAWYILGVLSDLVETNRGQAEVLAQYALRSVRALAMDEMLTYLLEQYLISPMEFRKPYLRLFKQAGAKLSAPIINILARNEVLYSYRSLMDILIRSGPEIREPLESRLHDSREYLVRKICFILGERRERESVPALTPLLDHPDVRIRKEAIRALSKIRGPQASRVFISKMNRKTDPDTLLAIIQAQGEMKDTHAVPALISQFRKRRKNLELLESIAEVLGRIGSKEALPLLIRTLDKRGLMHRERRMKLRVKAVLALGQIGGESALKALRRHYRGASSDELDQACGQAIEALGHETPEPLLGPGGKVSK
jgi:hypothetical protein